MNMQEQAETKVIKASRVLQAKVGSGPLDQHKVKASQNVMENNKIDFTPLGMQFLDELNVIISDIKNFSSNEAVEKISQPIMQLKGNAAMFDYHMIGQLASVMLSFIESIKNVDDDVIQIVQAHEKTLRLILIKKMSGDGGAHAKAFQEELKKACRRYFIKRNITPGGIFA